MFYINQIGGFMEFKEVRRKLEGVTFDAVRADKDNFFEAVVVNNELGNLIASLDNIFGPPVWPSKNQLSSRVQEMVKDFGGIRSGQILYSSEEGNVTIIAMIWPWQDHYHITIKIIQK